MSNPFDAIQAPVRDLHHQAGWLGTVVNYVPAETEDPDWFDDTGGGDSGWDDDGGEVVTIRVETSTAPSVIRGAGGREITGDAVITVDPTEHPAGKDGYTNGEGTDKRATEIVDGVPEGGYGDDYGTSYGAESLEGTRYVVTRVEDPHNGLLVLQAELQT